MVAKEQHPLPCHVDVTQPMPWLDDVLHALASTQQWGYHRAQPTSAEAAAFAAMAFQSAGLVQEATGPLDWLGEHQAEDGSVGVTAEQPMPGWPTSLAVLAWKQAGGNRDRIERGVRWLLSIAGKPLDQQDHMGHNTMLIGWPWVESTHSWLEPTAFAVLALNAAGYGNLPRTREAVSLIVDRLLPDGGANYGNTYVLGQCLRPHVQPSGIALWAIASEPDTDGRIERTAEYLRNEVNVETTTQSLSFALIGLSASRSTTPAFREKAIGWLEVAAWRTLSRDRSPYKLALLAIAANACRPGRAQENSQGWSAAQPLDRGRNNNPSPVRAAGLSPLQGFDPDVAIFQGFRCASPLATN